MVGDEQALRRRGVAAQGGAGDTGSAFAQQDAVEPGGTAAERGDRRQRVDGRVEGGGAVVRPVRLGPGVAQAEGEGRPVASVVEVAEQQQVALDAGESLGEPGEFVLSAGRAVVGVVAAEVGGGDHEWSGGRLDGDRGDGLVRAEGVPGGLRTGSRLSSSTPLSSVSRPSGSVPRV